MIRTAVVFFAVLALVKGQTTDVSRCVHHSGSPLPINTYISGCTLQPCQLPQGQVVDFNIVFIAPRTIHQMTTTATGILFLVPLPFNLGENAVTCNFLSNANCPVEQNQIILYTLRLRIEEFIPVGTQLPVEFRILDDNNDDVVCFRTQLLITAPVSGAQNATMSVEV